MSAPRDPFEAPDDEPELTDEDIDRIKADEKDDARRSK